MIKARQIRLHLTTEQSEFLQTAQIEAARCWNDIVKIAKDHYTAGNGWISKGDLQKQLKSQYKLHSQTIQALADKFCDNRQTIATLRRNGNKKAKYPWREKRFLSIPFKQMAIKTSKARTLALSISAGVHIDTGVTIAQSVNTCEILWRKGKYFLSYTADYAEAEAKSEGLIAGVDIGEIHPVALCTEDGTGVVISGREIRSIKQLRNKSLAWFSRALSRCKKKSRRWKRLKAAKHRLNNKTDAQLRNLLHQATRKAITYCTEQGIAELVIGNPAGVEKNTKRVKRLCRKVRQKVSQMETGTIKQYLKYKSKESGIKTCFVGERNTSKECPDCGTLNKPRGRVYRCSKCGFVAHRDGKASFMMIKKVYPEIPAPESFSFRHIQSLPKYRKRQSQALSARPACVDAPDVSLSSLAIVGPLCGVLNAA